MFLSDTFNKESELKKICPYLFQIKVNYLNNNSSVKSARIFQSIGGVSGEISEGLSVYPQVQFFLEKVVISASDWIFRIICNQL